MQATFDGRREAAEATQQHFRTVTADLDVETVQEKLAGMVGRWNAAGSLGDHSFHLGSLPLNSQKADNAMLKRQNDSANAGPKTDGAGRFFPATGLRYARTTSGQGIRSGQTGPSSVHVRKPHARMQVAQVQLFSCRAEGEPPGGQRKHFWFNVKAELNIDWEPEAPSPQAAVDSIPDGGAHPPSSSRPARNRFDCDADAL